MLAQRLLADTSAFRVADVDCTQAGSGVLGVAEVMSGQALVFPRRGAFLREVRGRSALVDAAMVYRERAGEQERFAHPFPGGDACTVVRACAGLLASVSGGEPDATWDTAPRPPLLDARLHRLRTACRTTGDVTEQVVGLLAATVAVREPERVRSGRPATDGARRAIVDEVRLLLQDDLRVGLLEAARHAGVSPHHLSRIFTRLTGVTFTEYRTRLRVRRALTHLEDGERDLAALAQRTGFADHAHLTRTLRAHTGLTPSALRAQVSF